MKSACSKEKSCQTGDMKRVKPRKTESKQRRTDRPTTKTPKGRKIGYVRVSDADQSEDLQVDALTAAGCVRLYKDQGLSGAKKHRPGLEAMLLDLSEGDTLTVWKLDRLGRSTIHLLSILEELQARGVHFHAITQGIDTSTAVGRMIFGQLAVFAEYERSLISERTIAGMNAARARGVHIGRPKMSKTMEMALDQLAGVEQCYSVPEEDLEERLANGVMTESLREVVKSEH